jgi:hypothetical protein
MLKYKFYTSIHQLLQLHIILIFSLQHLVSDTNFTWKVTFYGSVLKLTACVAIVIEAADETITIFNSNPPDWRK